MPAITAIYAREVRDETASFELEPPACEEMTRRWRGVRARGCPYLVAELDGRVAGYAYAGEYRARAGYRYTVECSVYVARWAQRRGLGGALLTRLIDESAAAGMRQMVAVIGDSAHAASIALHERAGFRRVGVLEAVGRKFDRWLDSVIMQRPLGPGDAAPPTAPGGVAAEASR